MVKQPINLNQNGGAIDCFNTLKFYAENLNIENFNALSGGAISFRESDSFKSLKNESSIFYYQIYESKFTKNFATDGNGGALYLSNVKSILIGNTSFNNNYASVKGGAIYFECGKENNYDCNLEIRGSNDFTKNFANESGGAIYWGQIEPKFINISQN